MEQERANLDQQLQHIFVTYTGQKVTRDVIQRLKQMLRQYLQSIVQQSLKRSILRDSFSNSLDEKDLLSVVQKLGPKAKTAIGYHLLKKQVAKPGQGAGLEDDQNNND